MNPYQITFQTWDTLSEWYEKNFMDLSIYNASYDLFCERFKKQTPYILELACGPGNITRYLLNKKPDLKILGTDISDNMLQKARKNCPEARFEKLDLRDLHQLNETFDGMVVGFCLPYLSQEDLSTLIADAANKLSEGAPLYLSCIEGKYETPKLQRNGNGQQSFMVYHEEAFIRNCLADFGFKNTVVLRIPYVREAKPSETHLIIIAEK